MRHSSRSDKIYLDPRSPIMPNVRYRNVSLGCMYATVDKPVHASQREEGTNKNPIPPNCQQVSNQSGVSIKR